MPPTMRTANESGVVLNAETNGLSLGEINTAADEDQKGVGKIQMADNVIVTCNLRKLKHKEYGVMRQDWFESNNARCKKQRDLNGFSFGDQTD